MRRRASRMEVRSWTSLSNALLFTRSQPRYSTRSGYTAVHVASRRETCVELSGALVGIGVVQTLVYLLFIRAIDLYEREPLRYVLPVFIWGFTVATTVSLVFNTLFQLTLSSVTSVKTATFFTAV